MVAAGLPGDGLTADDVKLSALVRNYPEEVNYDGQEITDAGVVGMCIPTEWRMWRVWMWRVVNPPESSRAYSSVWGGGGSGYDQSMLDSQLAWSAQHDTTDGSDRTDVNNAPGRSGEWPPWMQIDLETSSSVVGIVGQGRRGAGRWVQNYTVKYSLDGNSWADVSGEFDSAYDDSGTKKKAIFAQPIRARYVRIYPTRYRGHISMRAAVIVAEPITPFEPPENVIEVQGAGRGECNGVYRRDGEWRGHKRWKHEHNNVWLRRGGDGYEFRWYLVNCRERAAVDPNFYKVDGHGNPVPPRRGWANDGGGGSMPQLTGGGSGDGGDEQLVVTGSGNNGVNGTYERSGERDGKPVWKNSSGQTRIEWYGASSSEGDRNKWWWYEGGGRIMGCKGGDRPPTHGWFDYEGKKRGEPKLSYWAADGRSVDVPFGVIGLSGTQVSVAHRRLQIHLPHPNPPLHRSPTPARLRSRTSVPT